MSLSNWTVTRVLYKTLIAQSLILVEGQTVVTSLCIQHQEVSFKLPIGLHWSPPPPLWFTFICLSVYKYDFLVGRIPLNLEILSFRSVHQLLVFARIKSMLLTFIAFRGLAYCQKCHAQTDLLSLMCISNLTSIKMFKKEMFF